MSRMSPQVMANLLREFARMPGQPRWSPEDIAAQQSQSISSLFDTIAGPGGNDSGRLANRVFDELNFWSSADLADGNQADLFTSLARDYLPRHASLRADQIRESGGAFADLYRDQMGQDRTAFADTAQSLAPYIRNVRRAAEGPGATGLSDSLMNTAIGELNAGFGLTPEARRMVEQGSRANQFARGMAMGKGGAAREGLAKAQAAQGAYNQRQATAGALLGQDQAQAGRYNPFAVVSQAPTNTGMAGAAASMAPLQGAPTYGGQISGIDAATDIAKMGYDAGSGQTNAAMQSAINAASTRGQNMATFFAALNAFGG